MQALNYCRQFQIEAERRIVGGLPAEHAKVWREAVAACAQATKYLLPPGGMLLDDQEFRALPADLRVSLPHQIVALEFVPPADEWNIQKMIVTAAQSEDQIICRTVLFRGGEWAALGAVALLRDRPFRKDENGVMRFRVVLPTPGPRYEADVPPRAVLHFLNALACLNVQTERLPRKTGKVKAALPFDEYHVLVLASRTSATGTPLDGPRHGPREHVRRGHIRRLSAGAVWVNSTVVAAGRGGAIHKEYALRAGANA